MKPRIRTRNDRKNKRKRGIRTFLDRLFGIKKHQNPTFWQLRGRRCKTCEKRKYFHCSEQIYRVKLMHHCCVKYAPTKRKSC